MTFFHGNMTRTWPNSVSSEGHLIDNAAVEASQKIDEYLLSSKNDMDKKQRAMQILLLGQSDSGKSSIVKNIQLEFTPKKFETERQVWKTIIYLNLIGSVKTILDALQEELHTRHPLSANRGGTDVDTSSTTEFDVLSRDFRRISLTLSPLLLISNKITQLILPNGTTTPDENQYRQSIPSSSPDRHISADSRTNSYRRNSIQSITSGGEDKYAFWHRHDVCVHPGGGWKERLQERFALEAQFMQQCNRNSDKNAHRPGSGHGECYPASRRRSKIGEMDPSLVLAALQEDISSLWRDRNIRAILRRRGLKTHRMPGFSFLDDIKRIANQDYQPTNDDILKAQVRTLGVEEHHFIIERGPSLGTELYITDVGSCRIQRTKWAPYFEHVQTILFMAPLTFNETLDEDPEINRLEDTMNLWKEICKNKLLAHTMLIIFFNKKDVLAETLRAGIKVKRYVPSYGDGPNEPGPVTKYFCAKFKACLKKYSPVPRPFIYRDTCAIDTKSMSSVLRSTISSVQDSIMQIHIPGAGRVSPL